MEDILEGRQPWCRAAKQVLHYLYFLFSRAKNNYKYYEKLEDNLNAD